MQQSHHNHPAQIGQYLPGVRRDPHLRYPVANDTQAHKHQRKGTGIHILKGEPEQRAHRFGQIKIQLSSFDFFRKLPDSKKINRHAHCIDQGKGSDKQNHFPFSPTADPLHIGINDAKNHKLYDEQAAIHKKRSEKSQPEHHQPLKPDTHQLSQYPEILFPSFSHIPTPSYFFL